MLVTLGLFSYGIYEEFEYLGVRIDKEDRQENYIKNKIDEVRAVLNDTLWNRHTARKIILQIYNSIMKDFM